MHKIKNFVLTHLSHLYPDAHSELAFSNAYELCVAVMLSAQCTDKKVNEVTPHIFARFHDFRSLSRARLSTIETIIRPVNYYKSKAKNLLGMSKVITKEFYGQLPTTFEDLVSLPGIGRKCANVILTELGVAQTLPVDTHVFRVSRRLGLASGNTPEKVEEELKAIFKPKEWRDVHHWVVLHGRRVCKAQRPLCKECPLAPKCPSRQ